MKKPSSTRSTPRKKGKAKPGGTAMNQATTDEFEREDMGIAPKE